MTCPPLSELGVIDVKFNALNNGSEALAPTRNLGGRVILAKRAGGGRELLQHNHNAGYYDLNNAECVDRTWNPNATIGTGVRPAAEHILELQSHPRFMEFAMGATVPLFNGQTYHTTRPVIDPGIFATGGRYVTRWSVWDPAGLTNAIDESPADDVWRAYGDTNNAGHMVNTEPRWNNLKMQIFRGNDPIADDTWQARNLDDTANLATGTQAIGAIRNVIAIFDYMNRPELHRAWTSSANSIREALAHFQDRYNRNVPQGGQLLANLPEMWDEYLRNVLIPQIQNNVAAWAERRINILIIAWDTAREGACLPVLRTVYNDPAAWLTFKTRFSALAARAIARYIEDEDALAGAEQAGLLAYYLRLVCEGKVEDGHQWGIFVSADEKVLEDSTEEEWEWL
ncbi:hypothetical protein MMC31_004398, partial [Peltigera leucophlebia]|nr:hypothetical protein [Peltigera leucophlebia]